MKRISIKTLVAEKHRCSKALDSRIASRVESAYQMALEAIRRLDAIEPHVKRPGRPRIIDETGE